MIHYEPDERRDAMAFDILQNMKPDVAQAFFWNFSSRTQRREAILAWKANRLLEADVRKS